MQEFDGAMQIPTAAPETASPEFIWTDPHGRGRNVFVLFRREFQLRELPESLTICLFADTRYRLRVNGLIVSYGPARFMLAAPEYDSHEISEYLKLGYNAVTVEVNSFGSVSFEAEPSTGAFIAWSANPELVDFGTPGAWRSRVLDCRDHWAPPWSFAQTPVEIVSLADSREELHQPDPQSEGWGVPAVVSRPSRQGTLQPRSIPNLAMDVQLLDNLLLSVPIKNDLCRIGFRCDTALRLHPRAEETRCAYVTHIWSPRKQTIPLRMFWGPHYLNGNELKPVKDHATGNRQDFEGEFKPGWNLLYGMPEILQDSWGVLIGFPKDSGIEPRSVADLSDRHSMQYLMPMPAADMKRRFPQPPSCSRDFISDGLDWIKVPCSKRPPLPAREMAWDEPAGRGVWAAPGREFALSECGGWTMVFDAGREFIGHWILDLDAPAETVVDVTTDEVLTAEGMIHVYRDQFFNNTADRVICRGGRTRIEGFRPRGGRYLQLTLRGARQGVGRAKVNSVSIRRTLTPLNDTGYFECSDSDLTWAWRAGRDTIEASYEDAFVDPWRERGVYIGDTLVQHLATASLTADAAMTKRCLFNWGLSQRPDGLLVDNAPSDHPAALADYSLVWIITVRNYCTHTGDVEFARWCWPVLVRILNGTAWGTDSQELWSADSLSIFIDWAAPAEAKSGLSGALNALRILALDASSGLAEIIGLDDEAATYAAMADRVRESFQLLWNSQTSSYACSIIGGKQSSAPALHANLLALLADAVPMSRKKRVLDWVVGQLRNNHSMPESRIELYFLHYALDLLYANQLAGEAEDLMRAHYGFMRSRGAWTLWECLANGQRGHGSHCHGWSSTATYQLTRHVLGVDVAHACSGHEIVVAPMADGITWASGRVPHPAGDIEISWAVQDGVLRYRLSGPASVRLHFAPRGRLADLRRCEFSDEGADVSGRDSPECFTAASANC